MKEITILGSTGSVGKKVIDISLKFPEKFRVRGLVAGSNAELLAKQVNTIEPDVAVLADEKKIDILKDRLKTKKTKILSGYDSIIDVVKSKDTKMVVVAISGSKALMPVLAAIEAGKTIALANKESLVMAGRIIMNKARENNVELIPIDSEHSAIFQCLRGNKNSQVNRIYLTASGGALDKVPKARFSKVTPDEALIHPKWKMGKKISIDSATLMNKGLEVIEAMHLFQIPVSKIKVLIHPEAIIHSMVEFIDGSILAQLGKTDMRLPIQYALSFPERLINESLRLDFSKISHLTFREPDFDKFPLLGLAYQAARKGATYPCALNAADEELVGAYLKRQINLTDIPEIIEKVLSQHKPINNPELQDILKVDKDVRQLTRVFINKKTGRR